MSAWLPGPFKTGLLLVLFVSFCLPPNTAISQTTPPTNVTPLPGSGNIGGVLLQQMQLGNLSQADAITALSGATGLSPANATTILTGLTAQGFGAPGTSTINSQGTSLINSLATGSINFNQAAVIVPALASGNITGTLGSMITLFNGNQQTNAATLVSVVNTLTGGQSMNATQLQQLAVAAFGVLANLLFGTNITATLLQQQQQQQQQQQGQGSYAGDGCGCTCNPPIVANHERIRAHTVAEFEKHRTWILTTYFITNILPAMMLMTEQINAIAMHQVAIIGSFFDAKQKLETKRLMQEVTVEAHKDYQPSESLCEIGTTVRSLAPSERRSDLGQIAFSNRILHRQLLSGEVMSREGPSSDRASRFDLFRRVHCNVGDNNNGLQTLCQGATGGPRTNKDINYTQTVETPLTLDVDFVEGAATLTNDEEDIFALAANLYGHIVPPQLPRDVLNSGGQDWSTGPHRYLDLRSLAAKRSVAQNSFAAITAMKSVGSDEVAPFLYKMVEELGIPSAQIAQYLGETPSYFAQMEVLTKKAYQNPTFYSELYDKPANVERKGAALQAIALMQDRDIYRSLLRSESVLAVLVETMLIKEQERVSNELTRLREQGDLSNR